MSDNLTIVDGYNFSETSSEEHWHTPSTGGEICFNNQQWAIRMNSIIKEYNKTIDDGLISLDNDQDHIPYLAVPANPTLGWNVHHHTSFADGGLIFGGNLHDHRSNAEVGS